MKKYKKIRQLREVLQKSVRDNTPKEPYGIFLSGGVDSGLLAAWTQPKVAFTCKFPANPIYDEFDSAQRTVKMLGLKHNVVEVNKEDFLNNFQDAVRAYGKPTTHFSLVPLYLLFKRASETGLKTILSGEGPDEYLGGYASYSFLMNDQRLYEQEELRNYHPAINKYLGEPIERFARILNKDVAELKPHWDKYDTLLSKVGYTDLQVRNIEEMELKLAEHFGIKLVYPYMTPEVEEFCFREVPDDLKVRGFTTKYGFKKIAEKYIPKEVAWRKNKLGGPVAPIGLWLQQEDEFDKTKYVELQTRILNGEDFNNIRTSLL